MKQPCKSSQGNISLCRPLVAVHLHVWLLCVAILFGMVGCAKRSAPAPVATLQISSDTASRGPIRSESYQVRRGDTLYSIAFRAGQDFRTLAQRNQISAPYIIQPGQQLRMTGSVAARVPTGGNRITEVKQQPKVVTTTPIPSVSQPVVSTKKSDKSATIKSVAPNQQTGYVQRRKTENIKKTNNTPNGNRVQWQWPTRGTILSRFSHQEHGSKGLKIAGQDGQRINAAAAGHVVYAGNALRGYGNLIIIKHNDDYLSAYAHNRGLVVREQQHVKAGEHIANMGSTEASQTQLHFEIRFRGQSVDPLQFLPK